MNCPAYSKILHHLRWIKLFLVFLVIISFILYSHKLNLYRVSSGHWKLWKPYKPWNEGVWPWKHWNTQLFVSKILKSDLLQFEFLIYQHIWMTLRYQCYFEPNRILCSWNLCFLCITTFCWLLDRVKFSNYIHVSLKVIHEKSSNFSDS